MDLEMFETDSAIFEYYFQTDELIFVWCRCWHAELKMAQKAISSNLLLAVPSVVEAWELCRYWCADQMMVQKALSARSISDAQGATIFTGWIKVHNS